VKFVISYPKNDKFFRVNYDTYMQHLEHADLIKFCKFMVETGDDVLT